MTDVAAWISAAVAAVASAAVAACVGLFVRLRTNETRLAVLEAAEERNKEIEQSTRDLLISTARISERLEHLPDAADLQLLHNRISKNGDSTNAATTEVARMAESMSGLRQAVDRLHDLELARAKKEPGS